MLDIDLIRKDPDYVKAALSKRTTDVDIDAVLVADKELRHLTSAIDEARAERNQIAKAQADASQAGDAREDLRSQAADLKTIIADLEAARSAVKQRFEELMHGIPNLPDHRVPAGGKEPTEWFAPGVRNQR